MIALLFLVLSFLFGCSLVRKTKLDLNAFEFTFSGLLLGSVITTWIAFLLSLVVGQSQGVFIACLISGALAILLSLGKRHPISYPRFSRKEILIYIGFTIFWIGVLFPLFTSHMLEQKTDGLYSGGGAWGDLALHSTFINKFSGDDAIDLTSPIYAEEKTTYPFLFDFYASIFVRSGFSIQASLVLSGFLFTMTFLQLAFFLVLRLFKSTGAGFTFTVLFLFNGGIGFWYALQDYLARKTSLLNFLFSMKVEYAHLADYGLRFSNLIADYILPQRAFLIGLPSLVLCLMILRSLWIAKEDHLGQKIVLAILVGLLPLFHTHTFIALTGLIIFFVACEVVFKRKNPLSWLLPFMILGLLAFPQLRWQFNHTFSEGFIRLQYGWMKGTEDILIFWLRNLGLELVFFVFGGLYLLWKGTGQKFLKIVFAAFAILFLLTNLVIFQPHDYDNMKLMIFGHFAISLVATWILLKCWRVPIIGKLLAILCFIALTLTGGLSVLRESYTSWQIATSGDIEISEFIKQHTKPTEVFLTGDSHNHPVTMLAGRSIIMGYRGWLWTHGINYFETEKQVIEMFAGTESTRALLSSRNISYVYIGPSEVSNMGANLGYYRQFYPIVFENESGIIFDVRGSPLPAIANTQ